MNLEPLRQIYLKSKSLQRKVLRLQKYDYSQEGAYFVTICTQNREMLLGQIYDGQMSVNDVGLAVKKVWNDLTCRFPLIETDAFVIMPNHVHGIIIVGTQFVAPSKGSINRAPTLGDIVRAFKAVCTREVRENHWFSFGWQRNYYEHVIRDDDSLNQIREYIRTNPLRWELDRENPFTKGKDEFDIWLEKFSRKELI
jgi:putative transposase